MWVPAKVVDWFQISKDTVDSLRSENSALKAEVALLKTQSFASQTNFEWIRARCNQLEYENKALMERAYNIKVPTPEILRQPVQDPTFDPKQFALDDMGDEMARKLGFPVYSDK